jgi:hypothetical protein
MLLTSIVLGALGWYLYGGLSTRDWSWRIPRASKIDLVNGRAPILDVIERNENWLKRTGRKALEAI